MLQGKYLLRFKSAVPPRAEIEVTFKATDDGAAATRGQQILQSEGVKRGMLFRWDLRRFSEMHEIRVP